nr:hypothetical protein HK105_006788 [Polyrhizophydium stewartii]
MIATAFAPLLALGATAAAATSQPAASHALARRDSTVSPDINPCAPLVANLSAPALTAQSPTEYKLVTTNDTALSLNITLVRFNNDTDLKCFAKEIASSYLGQCPEFKFIDKKRIIHGWGNTSCCGSKSNSNYGECEFKATMVFGDLPASSASPLYATGIALVSLLAAAASMLLA